MIAAALGIPAAVTQWDTAIGYYVDEADRAGQPGEIGMTSEDIFTKVRDTLVDALGVDDDEVTLEARLEADLGAESIDFLDIVFRLEKNFSIKIPRGELFPEDVLSSAQYVVDGKVNAEGIKTLKARMPFADLSKFEQNPSVQNFANTLTVEDIASSASWSAATSSGAARVGASGPVPELYCPTRRPRPAHSASARKSRIEKRLKRLYQQTVRPRPSRVG